MRSTLRLLIAALGLLLGSAGVSAGEQPPNIVLILADDVGREAIGAFGGESYATPEIDKLAAEGLRFDHFYSATVCHPTRTTLLSGRYPFVTGNAKWGSYLPGLENETLAQVLRGAGYATAVAGKWQLQLLKKDPQQPHRLGFDEYAVFGWHEGPRYWGPDLWINGEWQDDYGDDVFGPDVYTEFLIDFMKRNREQPFFAFYSMALCHAVADDFMPRAPYGPLGRYENFGEMVVEMDERVGRLMAALTRLGLDEKTLVFFTTDNGSPSSVFIETAGKKFRSEKVTSAWRGESIGGGKGQTTDWGIRVPAIARWPGVIEPGRTTKVLADMSDLLPTLAEVAGAASPEFAVNGKSFAPVFEGYDFEPREWVVGPSRGGFALRTKDWKLVQPKGLLFDMRGDPVVERAIDAKHDTDESKAARAKLTALAKELMEGNALSFPKNPGKRQSVSLH